jgi:hypothetical protein
VKSTFELIFEFMTGITAKDLATPDVETSLSFFNSSISITTLCSGDVRKNVADKSSASYTPRNGISNLYT